jgi:hypothetical protein
MYAVIRTRSAHSVHGRLRKVCRAITDDNYCRHTPRTSHEQPDCAAVAGGHSPHGTCHSSHPAIKPSCAYISSSYDKPWTSRAHFEPAPALLLRSHWCC